MLPQEIQICGKPKEIVRGSFHIERADGKKVKGFLYSSDPRIKCSPIEFQGTVNEIHYQADLTGCEAGMTKECMITVCSEQGEYTLPVTIQVKQQEREQLEFPCRSLKEFTELASEDFQLAYRYFLSGGFREWLKQEAIQLLGLYDGLGVPSFSYQSMEEFLCAAGEKDPVSLTIDQTELCLKDLTETIRETIILKKNTWGFQKIQIFSEAEFLRPEKKLITTDEFAGSTFDLNLVIDVQKLHAGKNSARLFIETPGQRLIVQVTAKRASDRSRVRAGQIQKQMMKKLEMLYIDYRLEKETQAVWIKESIEALEVYKQSGGRDPYADLFLVQMYVAKGDRTQAYELLETFDGRRQELGGAERYGFYLYLTTFFYQEAAYLDRVKAELRKLYYRDKTNWKILWILLYLEKEYQQEESQRYELVREQFRMGCRSRILYLEAYQILKKNPFQMHRLGTFELALLRFGAKAGVLSVELIRQCANLTMHQPVYSQQLYEILEEGYRLYPAAELVKAICYLLMKGGKKDSRYFKWYEKGVDAGLRITGLYEYYMESMEESDIRKVPQIIRMYFAYDNALDHRKRAAIYRQMTEQREQEPQLAHQYQGAMEKFAFEQLECERISDDLAVLYQDYLKKEQLTRASVCRLARLLFTYEVVCERDGYTQAVVHSPCMKGEYVQALSHGRALVRIYDPNSAVFLVNEKGERYAVEQHGTIRRIFESEQMLSWCAEKAPDYPGIVLNLCTKCAEAVLMNQRTLPYFVRACEMEELTDTFRAYLRKLVLNYYMEHQQDPALAEFLNKIPLLSYVDADKTALITLLAEEGMCQSAFSLLDIFGAEGMEPLRLVRICSRMVLELEFEENEMLLYLCHTCFENGKYDDKILRYLLLYYEGPVQEMMHIRNAACRFELDTMLLEEKILMILLFTRSKTLGSEPVFEAYWKKLGRKKLCRAYTNLKAYEYFVKGIPTAECVFQYIEKEYQKLSRQNRLAEQEEVVRLALLQHYAQSAADTEQHRPVIQALLREFAAKGMKFAFWKRFDQELLAPYQMEGKIFVEYVCDPAHEVTIYYRMQGSSSEYRKEPVKNCFEGVFVKELLLFSGEVMECYLEEKAGEQIRQSDLRVIKADSDPGEATTKFGILNRICAAAAEQDDETVWKQIETWKMIEHLVEEVFTLVETVN